MPTNRFKTWPFIAALISVGLHVLLVLPLTLTYMYRELFFLKTPLLYGFAFLTLLACTFSGIALKRLGYSGWLALSGLIAAFIPLILYAVLPSKSEQAA